MTSSCLPSLKELAIMSLESPLCKHHASSIKALTRMTADCINDTSGEQPTSNDESKLRDQEEEATRALQQARQLLRDDVVHHQITNILRG